LLRTALAALLNKKDFVFVQKFVFVFCVLRKVFSLEKITFFSSRCTSLPPKKIVLQMDSSLEKCSVPDNFYQNIVDMSESVGYFDQDPDINTDEDILSFGDVEVTQPQTTGEALPSSDIYCTATGPFSTGPQFCSNTVNVSVYIGECVGPSTVPLPISRKRTRRNRRVRKQKPARTSSVTALPSPAVQLSAFSEVLSLMRNGLHGGPFMVHNFAQEIRNISVAPNFGPDEIAASCLHVKWACDAILTLPDISRYLSAAGRGNTRRRI
jgi:hypothetical protein